MCTIRYDASIGNSRTIINIGNLITDTYNGTEFSAFATFIFPAYQNRGHTEPPGF